jgi:hypothetical protein
MVYSDTTKAISDLTTAEILNEQVVYHFQVFISHIRLINSAFAKAEISNDVRLKQESHRRGCIHALFDGSQLFSPSQKARRLGEAVAAIRQQKSSGARA